MLPYLVALLALVAGLAAIYAPLPLPPPFQAFSVVRDPFVGNLASLEGPLAQNTLLQQGEKLFENQVISPETVVFDDDGNMFLFTETGIYKAAPKGDSFSNPELFVGVQGGRPLSGAFDSEGSLYFCDAVLGLGKLNVETREYKFVLSKELLAFCDDLVVSSEDEIFIADGTSLRVPSADRVLATSFAAVASGRADGRLLRYTPATGALGTLIGNLSFANGVALAHDESFVLASDGGTAYRAMRYWLKGPKAGTVDVFVPSLPGYMDGVSQGTNSTYWIAIFARVDFAQSLIARYRVLRWAALFLPESVQNKVIIRHGIVIQVDKDGNILRSFHDPSYKFGWPTSIVERKGRIFVGGFFQSFVRVVDLKDKDSHV